MEEEPRVTDPTEPTDAELTDLAPTDDEPPERRPTLLVDGYGLIFRRVSTRGAAE